MHKAANFIPPLLLVTSLAACNLQAPVHTPQVSPGVPQYQQTLTGLSTEEATQPPSAQTTAPQPTKTTVSVTPSPSAMGVVETSIKETPSQPCNLAAPGNPIDITVPDDTEMRPGETFTKTWRLRNVGSCAWTREYSLVWFSGEVFKANQKQPLPGQVPPGQTVDVSIDMTAPEEPGTYQSNWKLIGLDEALFGIGPSGDAPFWVRIVVRREETVDTQPVMTITPTPIVYLNGVVNMTPDNGLDLDSNQVIAPEGSDLSYTMDDNEVHILTPQNGAKVGSFGTILPTLEQCQSEAVSSDPITLDNVTAGSYFCFRTDLGLPGWARLVLISPSDNLLALEVLTWSVP